MPVNEENRASPRLALLLAAGCAGQPLRHCVLTHPWRRPSAVPAVDTPVRGCDPVPVAAGDLFVIETPGGGGYGAPLGSGAQGGGPGVTGDHCGAVDHCDALWSA